ncbi:MAG: TetR family transcriptional regulator [Coriobacteriaceae bacterium]|nr:TetR family transcriptional regulator [Coriobacteriaceae bacterium]
MLKRTQKAIVDAFNRLISYKKFDDITVADIVMEADVSKATFYRYFHDKYDVMNSNYKELLDEFMNLDDCSSYRDLYYRLYQAGATKLRDIKGTFGSSGVNSFEAFIFTYSRQAVVQITVDNRGGAGLTQQEELQLDVFCYGICYMYRKWIEGKYDLPADEAADVLYDMMPETLRCYWAKAK